MHRLGREGLKLQCTKSSSTQLGDKYNTKNILNFFSKIPYDLLAQS